MDDLDNRELAINDASTTPSNIVQTKTEKNKENGENDSKVTHKTSKVGCLWV
jgi:hypothetical protein